MKAVITRVVNGKVKIKKVNPHCFYDVYDAIMNLTDNDVEISQDVAAWCDKAKVNTVYQLREGTVRMEGKNG